MINNAYSDFLRGKLPVAHTEGLAIPRDALHPALFDFQKDIVGLALRRGRSAIFADTGLGKGWMAMEWLRHVSRETDAPTLLLAPLAVAQQFVREGEKFGVPIRLCQSGDDVGEGINVTNYHKLHKFDVSEFAGIALDESSILKSMDGSYRTMLIDTFRETPYRLACTATPSPNDHSELGNHAEFLGIMSRVEMLSMFFVHDGETTQEWRLKGHAEKPFWEWVASWAVSVRVPSDLGYEDGAYALPPLREEVLSVRAPAPSGFLFAEMASGLSDQRAARKDSLGDRVAQCAEVAASAAGPVLIWCDLNAEGDALEKAIPGAVQVSGADSDEEKEATIAGWLAGDSRVMISKPSILGFGLNFQHCADMIFCGITHSWEAYYQAIRRCWRFGQERPVNVRIVTSDADAGVIANLKRKQSDADKMKRVMVGVMKDHAMRAIRSTGRTEDAYRPTQPVTFPSWLGADAR